MANKNLSSLTATEVHNTVKAGGGMEYLCAKYDCLEGQIISRIKKFYKNSPHKGRKLIGSLRENDKKAQKTETTVPVSDAEPNDAPDTTPAVIAEEDSGEKSELTLEQQIEWQSQTVIELETTRKSLLNVQLGRRDVLRQILADIDELEHKITQKGQEYEDICLENQECEKEISALSEELKTERAKLDGLRAKLKVEIYIYNDESISASDPSLVLDDSGYEKLSEKLLRRSECRRLAVWEVELLARTLRVVKHLGDSRSVELVFESQQIEQAFGQISALSSSAA